MNKHINQRKVFIPCQISQAIVEIVNEKTCWLLSRKVLSEIFGIWDFWQDSEYLSESGGDNITKWMTEQTILEIVSSSA